MSDIVKYQTSGGEITLSPSIIRQYLVSGQGKITDQECMMFLKLCEYQKLNPFLREVYLIKYGSEAATMVTGKETFLKRAVKNPKYAGHKTGISPDGLVAWAEVYCHGYLTPIKCEVTYAEYVGKKKDGSVNKMWKSKPRTMLKKVALVQALREAFPQDFGGMYFHEEINTVVEPLPVEPVIVEEGAGQVIDAEFKTEPTEKPQLTEEQSKLWVLLANDYGPDKQNIANELKRRTTWTVRSGKDKGKQIEGKESILDLSDKQAQVIRHQMEAERKKAEKETDASQPIEPEVIMPEDSSGLGYSSKCQGCWAFEGCENKKIKTASELCEKWKNLPEGYFEEKEAI